MAKRPGRRAEFRSAPWDFVLVAVDADASDCPLCRADADAAGTERTAARPSTAPAAPRRTALGLTMHAVEQPEGQTSGREVAGASWKRAGHLLALDGNHSGGTEPIAEPRPSDGAVKGRRATKERALDGSDCVPRLRERGGVTGASSWDPEHDE